MNKSILPKADTNIQHLIVIEAFPLSDENLTGIGYATKNILEHLQNIATINKYVVLFKDKNRHLNIYNTNWEILCLGFSSLFHKKMLYHSLFIKQKNFTHTISYLFFYIICKLFYTVYNIYIPFYIKKIKADLYIGFSPNRLPLFSLNNNIKYGSVLYDLVWKLYPETMSISNKIKSIILQRYNIKKTNFLLSISNTTKNDFLKFFNYNENKIYTIHLASDDNIFKPQPPEKVKYIKQKYNIDYPYILAVGTIEPRKNLQTLIKAFALLKTDNLKLVLVGKKGWIDNNFFQYINELGIKNKLIFTDYVPIEDLPAIYSGAFCFVFPSIYEGFGLPLVEAMKCACPVIASNSSCIPEITGDAAILFNPYKPDELAMALHDLIANKKLRDHYIKKGIEQSKKFSWEKTAKNFLDVINSEIRK